jgi:hypothetical protein
MGGRDRVKVKVQARARGGSLVLALALGAGGCESGQSAPSKPSVVALKTATADWQPGTHYIYATHLNSKVQVAEGSMVAFDMTAELALDTRPAEASTELVARLTQAVFKAESPAAQPQFDAMATELNQPFGFAISGGKLSGLSLPQAWSPFAAGIARTLAAAFQFVERPAAQTGPTWTAQEVDSTGNFEVEYTPGAGKLIATHKLGYSTLALGKIALANFAASATPKILESAGTVTLGESPAGPRLTSVAYKEKLRMQLTPTSLVDSQTELDLRFARSEHPAGALDWSAALAGSKKLRADEVLSTPTPPTAYDANRIGDYTFPKALAELERFARDPKENQLISSVSGKAFQPDQQKQRESHLQAEGRAFSAMAALIRTDKKNIPLAVARIRAHSAAQRALMDALSSAGTSEAQQALVTLSDDDKLGLSVRQAATFSLTRTPLATADSVSALEAHAPSSDPLRVTALFGLGTIARRLREAGQIDRSDAVVLALTNALSVATTDDDRVTALRAIANSGAASAFDSTKPFLQAKELRVQAAAVDSLRLMVRPEVDGIIAAELAQPDGVLQSAALDAISVREPSAVLATALDQAAKSDARPANRLKAVRIMGQWLSKRPELRPSLTLLAESEGLDQIRQAAKEALGS